MLAAVASILRKSRESKVKSVVDQLAKRVAEIAAPVEIVTEYATQVVYRALTGQQQPPEWEGLGMAWGAVKSGTLPGGDGEGVSVAPVAIGERDLAERKEQDTFDLADYFPFAGTCKRTGMVGMASFGHSPIH